MSGHTIGNRIGQWMCLSLFVLGTCLLLAGAVEAAPPAAPGSIEASDVPLDAGTALQITLKNVDAANTSKIVVEQSFEANGVFTPAHEFVLTPGELNASGELTATVGGIPKGKPVWFRAVAENAAGERSAPIMTENPGIATEQWFDGKRGWFFLLLVLVCGAILTQIFRARSGAEMKVRKIAALDALDEAVGRATEMGKPCLFVAGVVDLKEMETVAGITVLSRVAGKAAEYDADVVVPTSRALVMTAARETAEAAYLSAGRPDAYQEDRIYYVTDDQFGFVAHLTGYMQREKPAACFYMGQFYAESLLLGETGNSIGAIQIAGTAQPSQLPFFVAACDYTLIGEEFFAASAYLSRHPDQLGSLKGQDMGKALVMALIIIGVGFMTLANVAEAGSATQLWAMKCGDFIKNTMLQ